MRVLKLPIEFEFGEEVYLKTDAEQIKRIVTGIMVKPKDILYQLVCADYPDEMFHYDFEMTKEKDISFLVV